MRTPEAELDFTVTLKCAEEMPVGRIIRCDCCVGEFSGVVEWASADTSIVVVRHVQRSHEFLGIEIGDRVRFIR